MARQTPKRKVKKRTRPPKDPDALSIYAGGEDHLRASLWLRWGSTTNDALDQLAFHDDSRRPTYRTIAGEPALHIPGKKSVGTESGGLCFDYQLKMEEELRGVHVLLTDPCYVRESQPAAQVTIHGSACLRLGAIDAWQRVTAWLERLGATITGSSLGRVDLCVDFPGRSPECLINPALRGCVAGYARSRAPGINQGETARTIYIGTSSRIQACIYDKRAQADEKDLPILKERRWGGRMPSTAMRVEFRVGKEVLKEKACRTVGEYVQQRHELADYLTHKWLRVLERPPSESHASRVPSDPRWADTQKAFATVFNGRPETGTITPPLDEKLPYDLWNSIMGSIETAWAREGLEAKSKEQLLHATMGRIAKQIVLRDSVNKVAEKSERRSNT